MYSTKHYSWWYCFRTYWRQAWDLRGPHRGFFVRTPLFAIGYMHNGLRQQFEGGWTGWAIDYVPVDFRLRLEPGRSLYRHHWDNYRRVQP